MDASLISAISKHRYCSSGCCGASSVILCTRPRCIQWYSLPTSSTSRFISHTFCHFWATIVVCCSAHRCVFISQALYIACVGWTHRTTASCNFLKCSCYLATVCLCQCLTVRDHTTACSSPSCCTSSWFPRPHWCPHLCPTSWLQSLVYPCYVVECVSHNGETACGLGAGIRTHSHRTHQLTKPV